MTPTVTPDAASVVDDAASVASRYFGALLPPLETHAAELSRQIARLSDERLTASEIDALVEPHAHAMIDEAPEPIYGAGFIATADLLTDTPSHLAWWQGADRRKLVFAPQSVKQGIDYRELEWFRVPQATGRAHVAGPYVDYLCSDEYTMTAAAPVIVGGEFVGVAGLDVMVDAIERRLTPALSALPHPVVLINGIGRVLVSTDARFAAGDAVRVGTLDVLARSTCAGVDLDACALA